MSMFNTDTTSDISMVDYFNKIRAFIGNPNERVLVINGGAGTGKTHLLGALKDVGILPMSTCYTATTNKAANVLSQFLNAPVSTIYSLLSLRVRDNYDTGKTELKRTGNGRVMASLVVIDEAFMLTQEVIDMIEDILEEDTQILYVGDGYQLPPVFHDHSPIEDIQNTITLSTIKRSEHECIKKLNLQLRENVDTLEFNPIVTDDDTVIILEPLDFIHSIIDNFNDISIDCKIVAWRNEKVVSYNNFVNTLLYNQTELTVGERVIANTPIFEKSKIVIPTDSSALIVNIEDTTITVETSKDNFTEIYAQKYVLDYKSELHTALVPISQKAVKTIMQSIANKKQWSYYFKIKNMFSDLRLPFACTVHKSQGSTYDKVFIDVSDISMNQNIKEVAKLMYVAATRASQQVIICLDTGNMDKEIEMLKVLGAYNYVKK